jgi:hypothetical protein
VNAKHDRREFLKAAPLAAGAFAYAATLDGVAQTSAPQKPAESEPTPADVNIGGTPYNPIPDYPIRPVAYGDVRLTDDFWKPKVDRNATVTIPFEMQKLTEGGRGLDGGVLEAAIFSARTHPDPALQTQLDARVRSLADAPARGNSGF